MSSTIQTNVILSTEDAVWLDGQALAIRQTTGAALSRSKLLRGIVAGLRSAGIDLSRCRTEKDVGGLLAFLLDALSRRAVDRT